MKNSQIAANSNNNSLHRIVRTITFSQGDFSLILVHCNYRFLREQMVQSLREITNANICEINLPASVQSIYKTLETELGDKQPAASIVFGLESLQDLDTALVLANRVREEFRKKFPFPVLLWVNDKVLQQMIRIAPDFANWATTVEFDISNEEAESKIYQIVNSR
ncbi:MAG: hypothetical protein VKL59_20190 [Nostocaceae cyanobacterium]|nr:hypothetical protein [Nostocaceae cyanobacterium]